jgi:hypothetical protein
MRINQNSIFSHPNPINHKSQITNHKSQIFTINTSPLCNLILRTEAF